MGKERYTDSCTLAEEFIYINNALETGDKEKHKHYLESLVERRDNPLVGSIINNRTTFLKAFAWFSEKHYDYNRSKINLFTLFTDRLISEEFINDGKKIRESFAGIVRFRYDFHDGTTCDVTTPLSRSKLFYENNIWEFLVNYVIGLVLILVTIGSASELSDYLIMFLGFIAIIFPLIYLVHVSRRYRLEYAKRCSVINNIIDQLIFSDAVVKGLRSP